MPCPIEPMSERTHALPKGYTARVRAGGRLRRSPPETHHPPTMIDLALPPSGKIAQGDVP